MSLNKLPIYNIFFFIYSVRYSLQQSSSYIEATLGQQIPSNTTIMDSANLSVGSMPSTETPPPGYMSEDGDPMDQNDNMSELVSNRFKITFSVIFRFNSF